MFFDGIDPAKRRDRHLKLLADFAYLPNEADYLERLIEFPSRRAVEPRDAPLQPGYNDFLRKARETSNAKLRKKVDELLSMADVLRSHPKNERTSTVEERPDVKPFVKPTPVQQDPNADVVFTKLSLRPDVQSTPTPLARFWGCLPAGKGVDLFWSQAGCFVMKQPGHLRRIDTGATGPDGVASYDHRPCFDGRYVWLALWDRARRPASHKLIVIDLEAERVVNEIGERQALPPCPRIGITALGPGRVAVVGYFGRTYVATVELTSPANAVVKVVHEFRTVPKRDDQQQWRDPDLIFEPGGLFTLTEAAADAPPRQAVLAARTCAVDHPIIVDLPGGNARTIEQKSNFVFPFNVVAHDGVCDVLDHAWAKPGAVLHRISFSGVTERSVNTEQSERNLFRYHGAFHSVGDRWYIMSETEGSFRAEMHPASHFPAPAESLA